MLMHDINYAQRRHPARCAARGSGRSDVKLLTLKSQLRLHPLPTTRMLIT